MSTDIRYGELLAQAIKVLTEAALQTRPILERDEEASAAAGHPVWKETDRREPIDWAEFLSQATAAAAANIGGVDAILAGRPGSWEADYVRQLLTGTVGHDEEHLLEHRTEPVVVDLYVDEILVDVGYWKLYDDAVQKLDRRHNEIPDGTEAYERLVDEVAELEEQLEQQRLADWAAYGAALKANVEAAAARRPGLTVPVVVNVDLATFRRQRPDLERWGLSDQLVAEAIDATAMPGDRPPLDRIGAVTPSVTPSGPVVDGR